MPLYEYRCRECGRRFERLQKVSAEPVRECPYCSGTVDRLLGVPALQFKGSGWYVTDYGSGNGRKADVEPSETSSPAPETTKPTSAAKAGSGGSE